MNGNGTKRILVVDDEPDVRRLITEALQRQGYHVVGVEDGACALGHLEANAYDLMITDLRMPGLSGIELLDETHARYPLMATMVLTAYGTIQTAVIAMQRGAMDFLTKPFDIGELLHKVADCMVRRDRRRSSADHVMSLLVEVAGILSQDADLDYILDSIVELLRRTFSTLGVEIRLFSSDDAKGELVLQRGRHFADCAGVRLGLARIKTLAREDHPWCVQRVRAEGGAAPECEGVTVPLRGGSEVMGALMILRRSEPTVLSLEQGRILQLFGAQIGLALLHSRTRERLLSTARDLEQTKLSTVRSLSQVLGTFDPATRAHSERVAQYACLLGRAQGLPESEIDILRIGGLLHDLGKLGINDGTLQKSSALNLDEYDRIKLHPVLGARILSGMEAFAQAVPIVASHHEQWDGNGYPQGLAGEQIPYLARIVAVVDTYDALTNDRPYRRALSQQEALKMLRSYAGTKLQASMVETWERVVQQMADAACTTDSGRDASC